MASSLFSFQHHDNVSQSWAPEDCRAPGVRRMREKDPRQVNLILMSLFKKRGKNRKTIFSILVSPWYYLVVLASNTSKSISKKNPSLQGTHFLQEILFCCRPIFLEGCGKKIQGGFQLEFVSISQVINHFTCYKVSTLIGWNYSIQTGEQIL